MKKIYRFDDWHRERYEKEKNKSTENEDRGEDSGRHGLDEET